MKKDLLIIINIANAFMLIDITNGWHSFMMFLFIGEIPGTKITLSPELMMTLYISIACILFLLAIKKHVIGFSKQIHKSTKKLKLKRA